MDHGPIHGMVGLLDRKTRRMVQFAGKVTAKSELF